MMFIKKNANISHWNVENGYGNSLNKNEYPLRIFDSGQGSGIDLRLTVFNTNFQYECKGFSQGFKLTLTTPGSTQQHTSVYRIPLSEVATISIKPKLITTSKGLRNYEPNQRKCFYQSEHRLHLFKIYTQANCEEECLANFTKAECGCVRFSTPSMNFTFINGHSFHLLLCSCIWLCP